MRDLTTKARIASYLFENNAGIWPEHVNGEPPPDDVWRLMEAHLSLVPPDWKFCMIRNGSSIRYMYGVKLTDHPQAAHLKGKRVWDDPNATDKRMWDDVSATVIHDVLIRADRLGETGSINTTVHEVAHKVSLVNGWYQIPEVIEEARRNVTRTTPNVDEFIAEWKTLEALRQDVPPNIQRVLNLMKIVK